MSKVLVEVNEDDLYDIGNAIREKTGSGLGYKVSQMASAIRAIPTSTSTLVSKTITANGTYDPEDDNADGYSSVTVNIAELPSASGISF